ncbi:MAG: hypothetical protein NC093_07280 [Alistipes sp.]|nr:hypothetical protein [Alistipes sp.]
MNQIIYEITSGKKKSGEFIFTRDYNLLPKQMGIIFKILLENDIVSRTKSGGYILTENCKENAQELYLSKISDLIEHIIQLAEAASISQELLIDFFNSEIKEPNR